MRRQAGLSYVVVMFLIAALSIVSVRALEHTLTAEKRGKEAELLWKGMAYRDAIRLYYQSGKQLPATVHDLVYDGRPSIPERHLRKLYRDPMTGAKKWGELRDGDGKLIGVYSLSTATPVKRAGFPDGVQGYENAQHYSDWKFVYQPK
jgi:hypothetical protein